LKTTEGEEEKLVVQKRIDRLNALKERMLSRIDEERGEIKS